MNTGEVTVASGVVLTLDNDTVSGTTFSDTASGATIQIDDGTVLTLTGNATINGGTIDNGTASGTSTPAVFGDIDVTGPSTISNAFLNNGGVTVASAVTLTLSNDTVTGTTFNDAHSTAAVASSTRRLRLISGTFRRHNRYQRGRHVPKRGGGEWRRDVGRQRQRRSTSEIRLPVSAPR